MDVSAPVLDDPALTAGGAQLSTDDRARLLEHLLLMRIVEEEGIKLYKKGKIPGSFYDGRGQEAISVGATFALSPQDPVCSPLIRDLGAHLVRGTDLTDLFRHYMGRENALSRGREGNVHFGDRHLGVVGMVSMLPDMVVVAVGMAMAFAMRGEARCALSYFGDGATSRGDWHEALNWAAIDRLPVIFVLEDNHLAYSTPQSREFSTHPAERAAAYGIAVEHVDGNDVEAVHAATAAARERCLAGEGPVLINATTMRMHGHGAHDDARYVDPDLLERWSERDPVERYRAVAAEHDVDVDAVERDVRGRVEAAIAEALTTPMPSPDTLLDGVFCDDAEPEPLGTAGAAPWSAYGQER